MRDNTLAIADCGACVKHCVTSFFDASFVVKAFSSLFSVISVASTFFASLIYVMTRHRQSPLLLQFWIESDIFVCPQVSEE